jgi:glycosyltransferase involved in cell wall biosynthesis
MNVTIAGHYTGQVTRVAFISTAAQAGGAAHSLYTTCVSVRRFGIVPYVLSTSDALNSVPFGQEGISIHSLDAGQPDWHHPVQTWNSIKGTYNTLKGARIQLVHANGMRSARLISHAAWWAGVPLVCHIHMPASPQYLRWAFRLAPKPHAFVFCSSAVWKEASEDYRKCFPMATQSVIHNAVDLDRFVPATSKAPAAQRVGLIANVSPVKGIEVFLEAVAVVAARFPKCEFLIVGRMDTKCEYSEKILACVQSLNLGDRVKLLGYQENIRNILQELDVLVSSSHYESFGRTLIEAMACEVAVVATAVGGIPEVIDNGRTGLLVPPADPTALATAVCTLLDDPDLRRSLSRSGRLSAIAQFGLDVHGQRIVDLYDSVLRGYSGGC